MNIVKPTNFSLSLVALSTTLLLAVPLTGCGKFFTKPTKVNEPTALVKLAQSANVISPVFQQSVANQPTQRIASLNPFNRRKQTLTQGNSGFQVGVDVQGYVTASPSGHVLATDTQGKTQWQITVKQGLSAGTAIDAATNTVIVTDTKGNVIALDRATGQQRWQSSVGSVVLAPALIYQNRVMVLGNNGVVTGLSLQNGQTVWQFGTQNPALSVRGSASPILLDDTHALVATADGRIHAINTTDGVPLWSRRISNSQGASDIDRLIDIDATPVLSDNLLYVLTYSGQLVAIDMRTRQLAFVKDYAGIKSVAFDDALIVVTTLDGQVVAMDKFTGELRWSSDSLRYRGLSNPVITNTAVIVGDALGYLHVFDKGTGQLVEREEVRQDVAFLQLAGQRIIAQSGTGSYSVWQVNP